jgi:predicted DNA binding protein
MYGSFYISMKCILFFMRKMIMDFKPGKMIYALQVGDLFKHIEHFEMLEMLRLDMEKGVKVLLGELTLKKGSTFKDIKWPRNVEYTILKEDGNKFIIIFTGRAPNRKWMKMANKFKVDVIWTTPTFWHGDKMTLSCIGEEDQLKKIQKVMGLFGKISNIRYHKAVYEEHNLLSVLTDKQREILLAAKKHGYYDYPRKIDTAGLAEKVGVSKATVVEHLRKAEGRLMGNILAGY